MGTAITTSSYFFSIKNTWGTVKMKGFKKIVRTTPESLSIIVWGSEGRGKTYFALGCPEPIYHFNFDKPLEDVVYALGVDRNIRGKDYVVQDKNGHPKSDLSPSDASTLMNRFFDDFQELISDIDQGTIVLDTITQVYKLLSKVELDKAEKAPKKYKQLYMKAYNDAFARFQNLVKSNVKSGINLVMLAQARDVYNEKDVKIRGAEEPNYNRGIPYLASLIIRVFYDENGYRAYKIQKCTYNDELRGKEYDDLSYSLLMDDIKEIKAGNNKKRHRVKKVTL